VVCLTIPKRADLWSWWLNGELAFGTSRCDTTRIRSMSGVMLVSWWM